MMYYIFIYKNHLEKLLLIAFNLFTNMDRIKFILYNEDYYDFILVYNDNLDSIIKKL